MTRQDLIQELKNFAVVNDNNLVMLAAEEIEHQAAEINSKRTGRILLDLENERLLSDKLAECIQLMLSENFWEEEHILSVLNEYKDLRNETKY